MTPIPAVGHAGSAVGPTGLHAPRSVAIVGASRLEGGSYYGARLFANVLAAQPKAAVYPINPRYAGEDIDGHFVYATLTDLPVVPDLVVITTPVNAVVPVLQEAARLGVPTSVVISAERGDTAARRAFDDAVAAVGRESGMRIIGPNSMGIMNAHAGFNGSFTSATHGVGLTAGKVAAIAQSGAVIAYMLQVYRGTSFGYSWLISTGNEAGTSLEQLFEEVVEDRDTEVVVLFVEGIADGFRFRRAALSAQVAGKAVVMINAGVSESGREAVQSHTGRIAGADEMIGAVANETHIVRARSYEDLFDYAKALAEQALPRKKMPHGRRAAVITTSGGAGTVSADLLCAAGWTLPPLPDPVLASIAAVAKQKEVGNPVDVTGAFADKTMLPRILHEVARCEFLDAIFIVTGAGGTLAEGVAREIAAAASASGPELYVAWMGITPEVIRAFDGTPVSAFPDPSRAIAAAEASARFRDGQQRVAEANAIARQLAAVPGPERTHDPAELWTAARAMADVAKAGVICVPFELCPSIEEREVVVAAARVRYPVVLKIDSDSLNHKSDSGAVRLGLANDDGVAAAVRDFRSIAATNHLREPKVLVQSMLRGIEVLVGIKQDDVFGLLLVLGLGGTQAELHADTAVTTMLPVTRAGLERLLLKHAKLMQLLAGFRGQPGGNIAALLDTLVAIAAWALDKGLRLKEADFNPVIVNPAGAFVVDARAVVVTPLPPGR